MSIPIPQGARYTAFARREPIGPGMDASAAINPLVSRKQQSVLEHVEQARREGARAVAGGGEVAGAGFYVQPTVLADVREEMSIAREEEAIAMANDSPYGLAASLWSNDLTKAMNLVPRIEAGTEWVNAHVLLDPNMPFGGVKQSGVGRAVIEAYTEIKSVCIAH